LENWKFMKAHIRIFFLSTGFYLSLVTLSNAQVISLDSVLLLIDMKNPMLQQYDSKVHALNAYAEGSKSWMAPMVGIGPYWYPYPGQKVTENRDKGFWMFTAEQEIPNPYKVNAKRNYLASKSSVEEQGRKQQFNALRAEARSIYYQWIIREKKIVVLKENERIADLILKLARIRYPLNQGSLGNIYKAEARLHEVQNMILMILGEIEGKRLVLKALMNLPSQFKMDVDTTIQIHFHPDNVFTDTVAIHEQRSDVRQIDKMIETMRLNQQLQKAQAKPDFKIRFDHMSPRGSGMQQQFTLMGMISVPIAPWSSKMYRSEIAGINYEIEALNKSREAIILQTRGELSSMSVQLNSHGQQLENYKTKIIPALQKNYKTLMLAYEENKEQLPIVIDAWEAMNMAQMEYLNQLEEHYLMIVNYEKQLEK
jgi:cobalt-zinc-cadmium efflux system outer membrane protein